MSEHQSGRIVAGVIGDVDLVLGVLDRAVVDMVRRGSAAQWGTQSWSTQPDRVQTVTRLLADTANRALVVRATGRVIAVVVHGPVAPAYVPVADGPESYVNLLATDRSPAARGWGRRLLDRVADAAAAAGLTRQRVDCWAGAGGSLVRFYESCGFTETGRFTVGGWPGAVLQRCLAIER